MVDTLLTFPARLLLETGPLIPLPPLDGWDRLSRIGAAKASSAVQNQLDRVSNRVGNRIDNEDE